MKKKIVRIKDIAERAQTSKGTVDRVLHNRGRVAEDVRRRVMDIIKEMNYEPNVIAQSLKSQKAFTIAALIPDHTVDSYWEAPKIGLEKAEKELRQYGVNISKFVFNSHNERSFIDKAQEATLESPDGVLIAPIFYKEALPFFQSWQDLKIPFVLFNTQIESVNPLCYIGQDSFRSGYLAAKLLHFGLARPCTVLVAHINEDIPNSAHLITKEEGFRSFFSSKVPGMYKVVREEFRFEDGEVIDPYMEKIVRDEPELRAIYVTNSKAFEVAAFLERNNLLHIKLVGYDLVTSNLDYLKKDTIQFLINQNPFGQSYWGIHQLADYLVFKKDVPPIKFLPLDIITSENLDYYLDPA